MPAARKPGRKKLHWILEYARRQCAVYSFGADRMADWDRLLKQPESELTAQWREQAAYWHQVEQDTKRALGWQS